MYSLSVDRISAEVNDNRVLGFNKSVFRAMELADGDDLLLFEDDVVFDGHPNLSPPNDYLTLHLGANIIGSDIISWQMPEYYNEQFAKLHNCWQSHATLYSQECVKLIKERFIYHKDEYQKEGVIIFDEWLRNNILSLGRSYIMRPMVAYQRPRHSEIWNCLTDYTGAHLQGNEYLMAL